MFSKAFMIGYRERRRLKSLDFQEDSLLFLENHDLFIGGRRKTFDCALTDDLLKIHKFFGIF